MAQGGKPVFADELFLHPDGEVAVRYFNVGAHGVDDQFGGLGLFAVVFYLAAAFVFSFAGVFGVHRAGGVVVSGYWM